MKNKKMTLVVAQFLNTGATEYNLGDIDINRIKVLYRKTMEAFKEAAVGDYKITTANNINLVITNERLKEDAEAFQIVYEVDFDSSEYLTSLPELSILVEKYNQLVNDVFEIYSYNTNYSFLQDEKGGQKVLPQLLDGTFWFGENGEIKLKTFDFLDEKFMQLINNEILPTLTEYLAQYQDTIITGAGGAYIPKTSTIHELKSSVRFKNGDVVEVLGYDVAGDGGHHKRKIGLTDTGFGIATANGLYANIITTEAINVLSVGVKGDGVTDNTVLIQKLFDTYVATTFYFPKGTYITDPLLVRYHQRIIGEGWNTILKLKNNSTSTKTIFIENEKITIAGKEYTGEHVEIHDIMIDGNKQNNTVERHGVVLKETWGGEMMLPDCPDGRHYLHRVFVINHTGNGIWGQAREMMITDSFSARNLGNGLLMYSSDSYISNFTSFQNSKCGIVNSGEDHKYSNIKCFGNGVVRRDQTAYAGFRSTYACTVSTISVQENGGAGIECIQMSRSTFTGVFLSSNNLTLDNDGSGYPYPHPTEKYQIKLSGCFGQHIFNGVTLSDFRKTLVKKIFYCEGSNAYLTADVSCDPNTPIAKEDILTIIPENERIYYNRFKVNFNGLDVLREGNNNYPVHTGVRNCCRIARVKILRVQGKGSSIYFDVAVSASKAYRKVRVGCELSEASNLNINIYNISNEVSARVEFMAGSTEVTNDYIYFDLYATNINWTFINTSFDNFSGFYSSTVDTSIIPLDAEPVYTKPLEAFPDDWYKSKTITRTRYPSTNDVFTNSYEIAPNVIAYTAVYESNKPTNVDVNSPLSHYLPLPEPDITHDNVVSVVINPAGYATAPWIGAFGFETSYDISDSAFYLKVAKTHTAESDAGSSKPKLRHLITVVVNYNEEETI